MLRSIWQYIALIVLVSLTTSTVGFDIAQCKQKVQGILEGSIRNDSAFDIIYHGPLRGFKEGSVPRPLVLTYEGCMEACGPGSDVHSAFQVLQILATWVLPAIALFSQLPFESLNERKWRNVEAFVNWVGAPASALTTTMFNIHMIKQSRLLAKKGSQQQKDAYYVLSCINQYEYPASGDRTVRDQALLYGLLRPLATDRAGRPINHPTVTKTEALLNDIAFQLRLQRRHAGWLTIIDMSWFILAFVLSIVSAFENLGDNTTAHSLALGLLISWLPILVTMMTLDRDPVASSRCGILMERWLYNVDQVLYGPDGPGLRAGRPERYWDSDVREEELSRFSIGDFVGQGRRIHYCGVTNAVLLRAQVRTSHPQHLAGEPFRKALINRPLSWYIVWMFGGLAICVSFGTAFVVSFNTPTIGLGCRTLLYMVYFLLGLVSWIVQVCTFNRQDPPLPVRGIVFTSNALATLCLFLIMFFHVFNFLNRCLCKSSLFSGSSFGGYMDFENGEFYKNAYDLENVWMAAAIVGPVSCFLYVGWALNKWTSAMTFWKVDQKSNWDLVSELDYIEASIQGSHHDARSMNDFSRSRNTYLSPPSFNSRPGSYALRSSFVASGRSSQRRLSHEVDRHDQDELSQGEKEVTCWKETTVGEN